jgi:hypothetical protein
MTITKRFQGLSLTFALLLVAIALQGCGSEGPMDPSGDPGGVTDGPGNPNPGPVSGGSVVPGGCPEWPAITVQQKMTVGSRSVHITNAGDGSGRLFVVEQSGRIRVIRDDALLPAPFLTSRPVSPTEANRGSCPSRSPPAMPGKATST